MVQPRTKGSNLPTHTPQPPPYRHPRFRNIRRPIPQNREKRRESGSLFKSQLRPGEEAEVARYYDARPEGQGHVAGFDANIVRLTAQDG